MPKKLTRNQISSKATQFIKCQTNRQVEFLLQIPKRQLALTAFSPQYYYFKIPKSKGGFREIEAPEINLKRVQRKINEYLQYIYYTIKTEAAYGFIINPRKQKAKSIVSNASCHLGCKYMLNIDFDDFFHQISLKEVIEIFKKKPFHLQKNTIHTLAKICTNKGRLPMGAPTSPVLSNFACISLDKELHNWACKNKIIYTRFVDDLSFSAQQPITQQHYKEIINLTDKYQLKTEPTKTKWYGVKQQKIVTGILVGKSLQIATDYYKELDKDLIRLQKTMEVYIISGQLHKIDGIKKFKQEVMGKINFIAVVMGYDSPVYNKYLQSYDNAINPPDKDELSARWVRFSNYSHF